MVGILVDVLHIILPSLIEGFGKVVGHGRAGAALHAGDEMVDVPTAHLAGYVMNTVDFGISPGCYQVGE